jgi:hypothetical protein
MYALKKTPKQSNKLETWCGLKLAETHKSIAWPIAYGFLSQSHSFVFGNRKHLTKVLVWFGFS